MQVDFLKGGEIIFSGNVVVGVVGIFTGISKQGGFSLSINERNLGGGLGKNALEGLLKHSKPPSFLAREVTYYYTRCLGHIGCTSSIGNGALLGGFNRDAVICSHFDVIHWCRC